jgi:hypothetical protein
VALEATKEELKAEYKVEESLEDVSKVTEGMKKTEVVTQELAQATKPGALKTVPSSKIKSLLRKVQRKKDVVESEITTLKADLKQVDNLASKANDSEAEVETIEKQVAETVNPEVVCKKGDHKCVKKLLKENCANTKDDENIKCKVRIYREQSPCKSEECNAKFLACANQDSSQEALTCHDDLFTKFSGETDQLDAATVKTVAAKVVKEVAEELPELDSSLLERADRFTERPDYISPTVVDHLALSH